MASVSLSHGLLSYPWPGRLNVSHFDPDLSPAEILVEQFDGAVLVRLRGEHDLQTAPQVMRAIEPLLAGSEPVIVDLVETTFLDSSILHALLTANRRAQAAGVLLGLAIGSNYAVRSVLELTNLLDEFAWAPTPTELLGALEGR